MQEIIFQAIFCNCDLIFHIFPLTDSIRNYQEMVSNPSCTLPYFSLSCHGKYNWFFMQFLPVYNLFPVKVEKSSFLNCCLSQKSKVRYCFQSRNGIKSFKILWNVPRIGNNLLHSIKFRKVMLWFCARLYCYLLFFIRYNTTWERKCFQVSTQMKWMRMLFCFISGNNMWN